MLPPNSARQRGFALSNGPLDRPRAQQFSFGRKSKREALAAKPVMNSNLRRRHTRSPQLPSSFSQAPPTKRFSAFAALCVRFYSSTEAASILQIPPSPRTALNAFRFFLSGPRDTIVDFLAPQCRQPSRERGVRATLSRDEDSQAKQKIFRAANPVRKALRIPEWGRSTGWQRLSAAFCCTSLRTQQTGATHDRREAK